MPIIFRDPIWQFVGATIALVTLAANVGVYLRTWRRKAISYETLSNTPLLSTTDQFASRVKVVFDGTPVEGVRFAVFRVQNSGNLPVTPQDYGMPITVSVGPEARILAADIAGMKPRQLRPVLKVEPSRISIAPLLIECW